MKIKYENVENTSVTVEDDNGSITHGVTPNHWQWEVFVAPWIQEGNTIEPHKTEEEILNDAKEARINELWSYTKMMEVTPVKVGQYTFKGGGDSGYALKAWLDKAIYLHSKHPDVQGPTVIFYDVDGNPVELPIESDEEVDGWDVVLAVGNNTGALLFWAESTAMSIKSATSIEQVNAIPIQFPPDV